MAHHRRTGEGHSSFILTDLTRVLDVRAVRWGVERLEQQKSLFPTRTQRERIPKRVSDKAERFGSDQRLVSPEKLPLSRKSGQVGEEMLTLVCM